MRSVPEVLLYGVPALQAGGAPFAPERRFQLLALLALKSGEWVPRDRIAALLWPEHGNVQARRNLRNVVFKAHALAGVSAIQVNDHALRWDVSTDVQAFELAVREQRPGDAIAWRRGVLLEGLDDPGNDALGAWLAAERQRIDARWHQAALDHLARQTDPEARRAVADSLLVVDALDEDAMAALIGADLARGRSGHARRTYQDFAHRLADELGVEPSHRLRDLMAGAHGAVVPDGSGAGVAGRTTPAATKSFIGRKTEAADLMALLDEPSVRQVTLLGPGGVGKSSLARQVAAEVGQIRHRAVLWIELQDLGDTASVAARLAQRLDLVLVEGRDAVAQLAAALPHQPTLLILDNAEQVPDLAAFVDPLLGSAPALPMMSRNMSAYSDG